MATGRTVSKKQLAELLGLSPQALDGWISRGLPFEEKGGPLKEYKFDVGRVLEWKTQRAVSEAVAKGEGGDDKDADAKRRLRAEADLMELKLARETSQLVTLEDVSRAWDSILANCRARLLGVGSKVAVLVHSAETADECQSIIDSAVHEALNELANGDGSEGNESPDSTSVT